ncbi:MAG: GNAT family N-acetyltransferase [Desulfosarcina sp.]|nr:GNAT family N-acetyltransferase [Desulfobacterales bacterium]
MDLDKIPAVTLSGVRPGEEKTIRSLIASCNLNTSDLTPEKLRHFVVARKGDAVIGAVGLEVLGPHALLRSLTVEEARRGQGIATKLVEAVERYARSLHLDDLFLLTMTADRFLLKTLILKPTVRTPR